MLDITSNGLAVSPLPGWEARIFVRPEPGQVTAAAAEPPPPAGARVLPTMHVATIPLSSNVGDYGDPAVEELGPHDVLIVLKEFDPPNAGTPLFAAEGLPRVIDPSQFDEHMLQRTLAGQAGYQTFFHEGGRAFCLYVVLGGSANRDDLVPAVNRVLASVRIEPLGGTPGPPGAPPQPSVLDVVRRAPDLTTLAALVAVAGLDELLGGPGPLTLAAPSDAAFGAYADTDVLRNDPTRALDVLEYHVIREDIRAAAVGAPRTATTANGEDVTLTTKDGHLVVNGVFASEERPASNGVVQVLDGVLTPPSP